MPMAAGKTYLLVMLTSITVAILRFSKVPSES